MNIKILAALAISVMALSASPAFADEHAWHGRGRDADGGWDRDHRDFRGDRGHDWRHGDEGFRWHERREAYRSPRYCPPRYYAPASYYAPTYYAPVYAESAYRGRWADGLGVVIQLHLP